MPSRASPILLALALVVILAGSSLFQVSETEVAIRMRFGEIIDAAYQPGLHLKMPLIDNVRRFERRIITQRYDGETFLTSENKALIVDFYVKWRVKDPARYYRTTNGNPDLASLRLGDNVKDGIKGVVARRTLQDIVVTERTAFTGDMFSRASESGNELGIELIDVRVQSISLPPEVSGSVYQRMQESFVARGKQLRAEGSADRARITAGADRERTELLAKAQRDAQRLRGEGDALASRLSAQAYGKSPEFYAFYRSLQAYRASLAREGDVWVVSPEGEFFKYLNSSGRR
ncbi:MAG: protease modulator HflC [Steroidobacteraceae bacterium]